MEENDYTVAEGRKIFDCIEKDLISPEERARMFDEYGEEQLKQDKFEEGLKKGREEGLENRVIKEDFNIEIFKIFPLGSHDCSDYLTLTSMGCRTTGGGQCL